MSKASAITLYGIPNCDTVKKARAWLADAGVELRFHDLRKDGVPSPLLQGWIAALGTDALINRRGTTWRKLDAAQQALAGTAAGALQLMQAEPSVIKRPVVDWGGALTVGFEPAAWSARIKPR
ncbi:MAG: hypothetical protein RLZ58_1923 [Pseudomonadota bacterium]|jgi:Spx/MgsR family transcriptional regulator